MDAEDADTEDGIDSAFLNTVSGDNSVAWTDQVQLDGKDISFKLDTGAEVTVISTKT